ncbi:MAG: DUF4397 domain-containing protein [Gemmatimonadaceae bacterium]|nr:DUF4397 domain-containing protein [Gemmatimonadaceae bacterium]
MPYTAYRAGYPALLLTLAAAAACKGERREDRAVQTTTSEGQLASPTADAAERRGMSMVRMINALPAGSAASVSVDDKATFTGIDYKTVTPYTEVSENVARFRLQSGSKDTTIASNNEIMMDGSRYTIVALPEKGGGVRLRVLHDELGKDTTKAQLRVIHGLTGVGEIDVLFQGKDDALFDNVNLASEAGYKDVDPLNTTLIVKADGSGKQLLKKEMRFQPGHAYTVVLTGTAQRAEAIVVDDTAVKGTTRDADSGLTKR